MLAADCSASFSVLKLTDQLDKIYPVDDTKIMAVGGDSGDTVQFAELMRKNIALYAYRNSLQLGTKAAAHFIRHELAEAIRRNPVQCNLLLGGYDKEEGAASLYLLDYLGTMHKLNATAQGAFLLPLTDSLFPRPVVDCVMM